MREVSLLSLPRARSLGRGYTLRLLSAWEALQCRREGEELAGDEKDQALAMNACLIVHALWKQGRPVFKSGKEVLEALTAGQIDHLAGLWEAFDRENDPKPWEEKAVGRAKKGWSTRLMSAFSGVCSGLSALFPRKNGPGR